MILSAGGITNSSSFLNTVEVYDVTTSISNVTGLMSLQRVGHTASVLSNGKVLVTGGLSNFNTANVAELYDPATGF